MTMIDDSWYVRDVPLPERVSAGGVVVRIAEGGLLVALVREIDAGEVLQGYVLPKGGVDPHESIEQAALREIDEEAGLTDVTGLGELRVIEHKDHLKKYWAICHYGLYLTAQVESHIKDVEHHFDFGWFPLEAPPEMFWPCERKMLEQERNRVYDLVIARQNPKPRKKFFM
ncbi:MAG: NUDIX domain-containing protein [Candidatus Hydrogenedentes bacterium]|nr:NUDIX domain-containing protein [Candidatus Hydrogenedentota bacterium]